MSGNLYLPKPELVFYASVYAGLVFFSAFHLLSLRGEIYDQTDPDGYSPGWSWLGRPQDRQDYEWTMWTSLVRRSAGWIAVHLIGSELTRKWRTNATKYWYIVCGMAFVAHSYGLNVLVLVLFSFTTFLGVQTFQRKWLVWLYVVVWMMVTRQQVIDEFIISLLPNESLNYELWLMMSWNLLKILSACLDLMDVTRPTAEDDVLDVYSYLFYLPNLVSGPVFLYGRFTRMMDKRNSAKLNGFGERVWQLFLDLLPVAGSYVFMEAILHVAYLTSLGTNLKLVHQLSALTLYQYGYSMSVLFYVKYTAMYGLSMALARFEGMETLAGPRYIGIVHWFSDMWKNFDTGLYEFLFKYIYTVLCHKNSTTPIKFASSAVTFAFICIWHGLYDFILYWACLNYIVVVVESVARSACKARRSFFDRHLSADNQARCAAILGSQLAIVGALSNFLFFTGSEVGAVFFVRTYWTGGLAAYLCLTATTVCLFHTAEWIRRSKGGRQMTGKKLG